MATSPAAAGLRHLTRMSQPADRPPPEPKAPSAVAAVARLVLHGDPRVLLAGGQTLALERRAAALCALAALEAGCTRERAARWLWPDSDDPRRNLRQQLLRFRRTLGVPLFVDGDMLALAAGVQLGAVEPGAPLLGQLEFADSPEFAAWLAARRSSQHSGQTAELRERIARAEAEGDLDAALAAAHALLAADPDAEAAHRELMRLHYLRGDSAAGLAVHQRLVRHLAHAYQARPHADTEALAKALRDAELPARPAARSHLPTLLRPPRLVGRERELAAVHDSWKTGSVVLLLGEAGMGKSRLIAEIARDRHLAIVQGRPGDAGIPYATLARLLRKALPQATQAIAPDQQRELARLLPELAPAVPLPAEGQRLVLQNAVRQVLARAAVEGVAVDDLHFADDASIEMLLALAGEGVEEGLHWLFAQRPGEAGAAANVLRETLQEAGTLCQVGIEPLDAEAMAALVDSLGVAGLDGRTIATDLVRRTGGNPLFALETLKQGLGMATRAGVPATVGALIERRLRQLSSPALELARLAAVAGVDFDIHVAEAVLGVGALALADRWAELEAAQVLRDDAFAHDLVHEATLRSLPAAVAKKIHGDLAAHLESRTAEPARIAAHWQAAGEGLRAVPHLVAAAQRALAGFQPGVAAQHHETAADLLLAAGDEEKAFDQLFLAAETESLLSDAARLHRLRDRLTGLAGTPRQGAMAEIMASRVADFDGDYPELARCGYAVLAYAEPAGDLKLQAYGWMALSAAAFWTGRTADAEAPMRRSAALWRELGDARAAAESMHSLGVVLSRLTRFAEAREVMEQTATELEALQFWRELALNCHERAVLQEDLGRFDEMLALLQQAARLLDRIDASAEIWTYIATATARALRRCGRHAHALTLLEAHRQRFADNLGGVSGIVPLERAQTLAELGRPHLTIQALDEAQASPGLAACYQARVLALRLRFWAAQQLGGQLPTGPDAGEDVRPQFALERARLATLPAAERAAALAGTIARALSCEMTAEARGARAERVLALLEGGDAATAADEALTLRDSLADGGVIGYAPMAWWAVARALHDRVPSAATAALGQGVDWIARAVAADMPAEFVNSFLHRNPVNCDLLAAAAREPALAGRLAALHAAAIER